MGKHWMLEKMGGTWAPRPSTGPHKLRECLPLVLILRNRLKYAPTNKEVQRILAASREGGRQGPHRRQLPCWFHGCHLPREVRRALPPPVRREGPLRAPPAQQPELQSVPRAARLCRR